MCRSLKTGAVGQFFRVIPCSNGVLNESWSGKLRVERERESKFVVPKSIIVMSYYILEGTWKFAYSLAKVYSI